MDRTSSIADVVFAKIEKMLLDGTFAPGEVISENRISSMLDVSRTPVREALTRLRQEGLIEESGKGAVVLGITKDDICDIYDIRMKIEGFAFAKCAENIDGEKLKKLRETVELQEFYTAKGNADNIKNADSEFHSLVYSYCGSRILESILSELHRKVQRFRQNSVTDHERAEAAAREHRAILDALTAHDSVLAEKLAVEHISNAKKSIMRRT